MNKYQQKNFCIIIFLEGNVVSMDLLSCWLNWNTFQFNPKTIQLSMCILRVLSFDTNFFYTNRIHSCERCIFIIRITSFLLYYYWDTVGILLNYLVRTYDWVFKLGGNYIMNATQIDVIYVNYCKYDDSNWNPNHVQPIDVN